MLVNLDRLTFTVMMSKLNEVCSTDFLKDRYSLNV